MVGVGFATVNIRRLRPHVPIISAVAAIVGSSYLLAVFASEMVERELGTIDEHGRRWAASARTEFADSFFSRVTYFGSMPLLTMLTVVGLIRVRHRGRRVVLPVIAALLLAGIATEVLKSLFARARPVVEPLVASGYSFPSGHTTAATAVALTWFYLLAREDVIARVHLVWPVTLAVTVGVSRVYLGAHWASDVLAGWLAGIGIASCCGLLYEAIRARQRNRPGAA